MSTVAPEGVVVSEPAPAIRNTRSPEPIKAVKVKHYGQAAAAVIVLAFAGSFVLDLARNEKLDYSVIGEYFTAGAVLKGLLVTFELTVIAMVAGTVIGILVALARMSENVVLRAMASFYIWFFRGVPLLVQILIWGNFGLLFSQLGIGIPFTGISLVAVDTNTVLTSFVAAAVGLALHEAAYMAEIVRGGIMSVHRGQSEAATALGMTGMLAMRRIILPQALRIIIPPTGNNLISLLKATSMVYVIAGGDLMTAVNDIAAGNYRIVEMLMVASIWYLGVVTVLGIGQRFLEKRAARGLKR